MRTPPGYSRLLQYPSWPLQLAVGYEHADSGFRVSKSIRLRHRRRDELRSDQDRLPQPLRSSGEIQSTPAHRTVARQERRLLGHERPAESASLNLELHLNRGLAKRVSPRFYFGHECPIASMPDVMCIDDFR